MEIEMADLKRLSKEEEKKLEVAKEHILKKGNVGQTFKDEEKIRRMLKLSPNISPCSICATVSNRSMIESYSMPQLIVFKSGKWSEDNLEYIIAPFRHMSNEEFIVSPVLGFVSRMFGILQSIVTNQYDKVKKFEIKMDNTYGTYQQEIGEHGHLVVKFFKEK